MQRNRNGSLILLNLLILLVNFFLAYTSAGSQNRVLRSSARLALSGAVLSPVRVPPSVPQRAAPPAAPASASSMRLLRLLASLPDVDSLTARQFVVVQAALDDLAAWFPDRCRALRTEGVSGTRIRAACVQVREEALKKLSNQLQRAGIGDAGFVARLSRAILLCVG